MNDIIYMDIQKIKELIKKKKYKITGHTKYRKSIRKIKDSEMREAILSGKIIEEKPDDKPISKLFNSRNNFKGKIN